MKLSDKKNNQYVELVLKNYLKKLTMAVISAME